MPQTQSSVDMSSCWRESDSTILDPASNVLDREPNSARLHPEKANSWRLIFWSIRRFGDTDDGFPDSGSRDNTFEEASATSGSAKKGNLLNHTIMQIIKKT